jgi:hypothetical protein
LRVGRLVREVVSGTFWGVKGMKLTRSRDHDELF